MPNAERRISNGRELIRRSFVIRASQIGGASDFDIGRWALGVRRFLLLNARSRISPVCLSPSGPLRRKGFLLFARSLSGRRQVREGTGTARPSSLRFSADLQRVVSEERQRQTTRLDRAVSRCREAAGAGRVRAPETIP